MGSTGPKTIVKFEHKMLCGLLSRDLYLGGGRTIQIYIYIHVGPYIYTAYIHSLVQLPGLFSMSTNFLPVG